MVKTRDLLQTTQIKSAILNTKFVNIQHCPIQFVFFPKRSWARYVVKSCFEIEIRKRFDLLLQLCFIFTCQDILFEYLHIDFVRLKSLVLFWRWHRCKDTRQWNHLHQDNIQDIPPKLQASICCWISLLWSLPEYFWIMSWNVVVQMVL